MTSLMSLIDPATFHEAIQNSSPAASTDHTKVERQLIPRTRPHNPNVEIRRRQTTRKITKVKDGQAPRITIPAQIKVAHYAAVVSDPVLSASKSHKGIMRGGAKLFGGRHPGCRFGKSVDYW